jgi:hypothetical protein
VRKSTYSQIAKQNRQLNTKHRNVVNDLNGKCRLDQCHHLPQVQLLATVAHAIVTGHEDDDKVCDRKHLV